MWRARYVACGEEANGGLVRAEESEAHRGLADCVPQLGGHAEAVPVVEQVQQERDGLERTPEPAPNGREQRCRQTEHQPAVDAPGEAYALVEQSLGAFGVRLLGQPGRHREQRPCDRSGASRSPCRRERQ